MLGRSSVGVLVAVLLSSMGVAQAAPPRPKAKAAGVKPKPAPAKPKKGKEKDAEKDKETERDKEQDAPESDASSAAEDAKNSTKEEGVKAAGTASAKDESGAVKVKEDKADKEGVKTYKFETVEVEGRLKSPQVIYFLRRVRAEFEAGALGHRSFLGELSDSRRSTAFR
jgi:hypothetical protein